MTARILVVVSVDTHRANVEANPMDPSRRIARDLKACLVAGPILLLMWFARGCG